MLTAKLPMEYKSNTVYHGTLLIFILIFYQQVFVLNIGGSFKLYELVASVFFLFWLSNPKIYSKHCLVLFLFFVIAPIPGNITFLLNDDRFLYYKRFPEAMDIARFNINFAPSLIYFYYLICFAAINVIVGSRKVFEKHTTIVKWFVISGTIVSLYSLYGFIFVSLLGFPDLIPTFMDYRNSNPVSQIRPSGFSSEPGTYVLSLSWIILYLFFYRGLFSRRVTRILFMINLLVLLLTMSTLILVLVLSLAVYVIIFERLKYSLYLFAAFFIMGGALYVFSVELIGYDHTVYYFFGKISSFLSPPTETLGSGSFRAYTSLLGLELFKEFPIFGVGGGNSYFFLWKNEFNMGIKDFFLVIDHSTPPQNCHAKILAELGLFGYSLFIIFFAMLIRSIVKAINGKQIYIYKAGFVGVVMTFFMLLSIYPEYSLFIWINLALILNHIYWSKQEMVRGV